MFKGKLRILKLTTSIPRCMLVCPRNGRHQKRMRFRALLDICGLADRRCASRADKVPSSTKSCLIMRGACFKFPEAT